MSQCRESTGTELPLCFVYSSLTGTVSTSPNLAKARPEGRVVIVALRAPSLAEFGEVDTVPVSEKCDNIDSYYMYGDTQNTGATRSQCLSTFRP